MSTGIFWIFVAHHNKVDEGDGISVDPEQVHTTEHVQNDHTDDQHEYGSCPQV